jgi:aspartate racemase
MHTFPLSDYMRYIDRGEWSGVADLMLASAEKVAEVGAEFAICPDNTVHQALDLLIEKSPVPWLHIAEEVAIEARRNGYRNLGVLGTRFLMEGPVYPAKLTPLGIHHRLPGAATRERINEIIFDELVYGRFSSECRTYMNAVISELKRNGCDAVVLGCTEIPLLVGPEDSPLPTLDSTRILARAALKRATDLS